MLFWFCFLLVLFFVVFFYLVDFWGDGFILFEVRWPHEVEDTIWSLSSLDGKRIVCQGRKIFLLRTLT